MCHELEMNGSTVPVFHTDDFILKVTVGKVTRIETLKQCVVNTFTVSVLTKADFGKLSNKKDYNFLGTKQHFLGYFESFLGYYLTYNQLCY